MSESEIPGASYIYPEDECLPACPICGFADRTMSGHRCPHYVGFLIQEDDCVEGEPAEEFLQLWMRAAESGLVDEADEDAIRSRIQGTALEKVYEAVRTGDRYWWLDAFPDCRPIPDPVAPGQFYGWAIYDRTPARFESVLRDLRMLIELAESCSPN